MAQSQIRPVIENETPEPRESDQEAWCATATTRKFRVADGSVWLQEGGEVAPLPALRGFASLPAESRQQVFHALAQFAQYRIGQQVDGKSLSDALVAFMSGASIPPVHSNDAFEDAYLSLVADAVESKLGELGKDATAEMKTERRKVIVATAEKLRSANFDEAVSRAKTAGATARSAKERKRAAAKPKTDAAVEVSLF